jgi:hypothetical protein
MEELVLPLARFADNCLIGHLSPKDLMLFIEFLNN